MKIRKLLRSRSRPPAGRAILGFDADYYVRRYPDVAEGGWDALSHYVTHGRYEGRDPNPHFNAMGYVRANPDVAASGLDPLSHFLSHGLARGYRGWQRPGARNPRLGATTDPASKPGPEAARARVGTDRADRRLGDAPPAAPAPDSGDAGPPRAMNPYAGLPASAFWDRAVGSRPLFALDPMEGAPVPARHRISPTTRVATAGSCFAQHIARRLRTSGYTYHVAEDVPAGLSPEEGLRRQYGVFSARYGNIYTARQLRQLLDRAYGRFDPAERAWRRPDGRWVDPFRPRVEPDGYAAPAEVEAAREAHLAHVRDLFETLEVLVFTLGLTEGWRSAEDGAVFPLAPGVAGGTWDPGRYAFVNFSVSDVAEDLTHFAEHLRRVNPRCALVLTVSPVPLAATYEERHVLQSTVLSKSVLRVAAQTVSDARDDTTYFPSFEIITAAESGSRYMASDLRSVTDEGVSHVMRVFFRHFTDRASDRDEVSGSRRAALRDVIEAERNVVCDEDAIRQSL